VNTSMPRENLTLTEADLAWCRPVRAEGGRSLRAFCPFHGSDHQRSLRLHLETGRFYCFACQAWGYTEDARQRWQDERVLKRPGAVRRDLVRRAQPDRGAPPNLPDLLAVYQTALPGSPGERYLRHRRIPLDLARQYGVGFAAHGTWANPARDCRGGRLIAPHTDPEGRLVNLYGRAVDLDGDVPDHLRHDHLPGRKGYFNATAIQTGDGPVFVCEGAFDALSLITAGYTRAVAIFGIDGWCWEWARNVATIVLALDADQAGEDGWRHLGRAARLRGKAVIALPPAAYGGRDDPNAAWTTGTLDIAPYVNHIALVGPPIHPAARFE